MKIKRRLISVFMALIICVGILPVAVVPANADNAADNITAFKGEEIVITVDLAQCVSFAGSFSFTNADLITSVKAVITTNPYSMSDQYYENNTMYVSAFGSRNMDVTIKLVLTLAETATPGDKINVTFKYESFGDGEIPPTIPVYTYAYFNITVGVDYRELKNQIARADALAPYEKDYTPSSWADMRVAYAAARIALTSTEQSEVDTAANNLRDALDKLVEVPTNYAELLKLIKEAEALREADYTPASWANLDTALKAARAALSYKEQTKVDKAAKNLKNAIQKLVKISSLDFSELRRQIARAQTLIESEYTPESWAQFVVAFDAAKKALNAKEQATIDTAANNLKNAIGLLVRTVNLDYSALLALIEQAEGLKQSDYTLVSWNAMIAVLGLAREALNSPIQSEVDTATENLRNAINNLVSMNFKALLDAIAAVMKYAEDDRLAELWMQMHELLNQAEQLMESGDQAAVDQCAMDIVNLLAKIVEEMDKLKNVETIQVVKPLDPNTCNISMHKVWQILFWISLVLNIILIALIVVYMRLKRKRVSDDTPLVDYDIEDDELA